MNQFTVQQEKALDLSRHTLVTANAGSGKTFILSKRFFKTILEKKLKYNQIVAITFTEKAAAELLARISREIDDYIDLAGRNLSHKDLNRIKTFREHILSARISTIHSFCFDLLKEFPVEAEIDPSTEIMDNFRKEALIKNSIQEALVENVQDEQTREILRIFGKENTFKLLQSLIEKRYFTDQLIEKIYQSDNNSFDKYYNFIYQTAINYFRSIYLNKIFLVKDLLLEIKSGITSKNKNEELLEIIDVLIKKLEKFIDQPDFNFLFEILTSIKNVFFTTPNFEIKKSILNNIYEHPTIEKFRELFIELKDFINDIRWDKESEKKKYETIHNLLKIYSIGRNKYEHIKSQEGVLDFDDLLILADKLLDFPHIRDELNKRFLFILVDEFQDTDFIQMNIIKKMTNNFKTNNVFVVGDEKQSIYGFRNAQLEVFQNFKSELKVINKDIEDHGLVTLSTSYRASPSIAAFVNFIFSKIWKKIDDSLEISNYHQEVEYSPLQIGRDKFSDEAITFIIIEEDETHAQKVADYILYLINSEKKIFDRGINQLRKITFGDIALLFRTRKEIKEFEDAFIEKNIPFFVSGGRGFFQTEEIQDWINYINFLSNPSDDYALLSILRSPFFALSDNEILRISLNEGNTYFEKLKNLIESNDFSSYLKEIYSILNSHIKISTRYTIPELLQNILKDTSYYGKIDYNPQKPQIIANIKKFIGLTHQFTSKGLVDLRAFSTYLRVALEQEEASEAIISELKTSVQLMTIHQSKGLEFPVVILPNFEKELNVCSIKFGEVSINNHFGFVFKLTDNRGNNFHTLSSFFGNKINEGIQINEETRLLYVALTRATEKLIISFSCNPEINNIKKFSFKNIILNTLPPFNFNENNSLSLNTKLVFLRNIKEKPTEIEENYELKIEILSELQNLEKQNSVLQSETPLENKNLKIFTDRIIDKVKEEIFTATQINTYQFCPAKYLLKFIIGYNPSKKYFSEISEDDNISGSDLGLLFHQLMEKIERPDMNEFEIFLAEILQGHPPSIQEKMGREIKAKLKYLMKSKKFLKIFDAQKSYREFQIRVKFQNHILFGIIDRINFNDDRITIIDYKTDIFHLNDYEIKVNEYKTQMEFYVLLVSEFFKKKENINLIIFFVNHPNNPFEMTYFSKEIEEIKTKISIAINNIENGVYDKNFENCNICEFAINGICILK